MNRSNQEATKQGPRKPRLGCVGITASFAGLVLLLTGGGLSQPIAQAASPLGGVQVIELPDDQGITLAVVNSNRAAVTLTVTVFPENAKADREMPAVLSVPGPGQFPLTRLLPLPGAESMSYRLRTDWQFGSLTARHASNTVYELPFESSRSVRVSQGFHGSFSHTGGNEFAVDFDLPEGTRVLASREGVVDVVVDRFDSGGTDPALRDRANFVLVRHPDETYGEYLHLRKGGAAVRPGDRVRPGTLLGYSGFTGYAQAPHLHFAVFRAVNGSEREAFPVRFRAREGAAVEPEEGKPLTAP